MRLTFWGTRGSIGVPGPDTVVYGGNTTCLGIETCDETIILDAGTGIRGLGVELARSMPVTCSIFISHTHWDHIQGLPFFVPLFVPGNTIKICGTFDPVNNKDLREVLAAQMDYNYFPVRSAELAADISYLTLREGQTVDCGSAQVTPVIMNHPVISFGYKVSCGGKSVFFTGDHEDYANIYEPGDPFYEEYETIILQKRAQIAGSIRGVDVLVSDCQYTEEEYPSKAGWGHSTPSMAVALAQAAGVKRLFLTHHEPTRPDAAMALFHAQIVERFKETGIEIDMAREGLSVEI
ncbi:MAG: MBL fold metallo-hydrolase [Desulfovibrionaceae bacterium]|nr:MBL fold metallo-hydrolase [Desulfovibrionaceae bacterium]MBF0515224.1 MBL fold metallo-hydrolase [Desulfovibrionaceae bacterium]